MAAARSGEFELLADGSVQLAGVTLARRGRDPGDATTGHGRGRARRGRRGARHRADDRAACRRRRTRAPACGPGPATRRRLELDDRIDLWIGGVDGALSDHLGSVADETLGVLARVSRRPTPSAERSGSRAASPGSGCAGGRPAVRIGDGRRGSTVERRAARWGLFLGIAVAVVVVDQLSKAWLVANVAPGGAIEVVGDWLRLVHGRNDGGLFGLFQGSAIVLAIASLAVIGLIVAYHARSKPSVVLSVALGLLLGGAIGNLIDRIRYGYVVDFVDAGSAASASTRSTWRTARSASPSCCSSCSRCSRRSAGREGTAPMAERSGGTAVGVRMVRVPDGGRGRADRIVADATGLSRSYVQKLISGDG